MGWRKRRFLGSLAVACLLLVTHAGCCRWARPRHGVILRGDWSVELNRVPWLASRADVHEECSVGDSTGCLLGNQMGTGGEVRSGCRSGSPTVAPPPADDLSGGGLPGATCRLCRGLGGLREAGPTELAAAVTYRHSRFHPVPTRPVFLPRTGRDAPVGDDLDRLWQGTDLESPPLGPAPLPPEIEVIPTPPPDPNAGRKAEPAEGKASGPRPVGWMFSVPGVRWLGRMARLPGQSVGDGNAW